MYPPFLVCCFSSFPDPVFSSVPLSWFAEGCGEFLAPVWGLSLSCTAGDGHGYCVLPASATTAGLLEKFRCKVRQTPAHPLTDPWLGSAGVCQVWAWISSRGDPPCSARCRPRLPRGLPRLVPTPGPWGRCFPRPGALGLGRSRGGVRRGGCGCVWIRDSAALPAAHAASGAAECGSANLAAPSGRELSLSGLWAEPSSCSAWLIPAVPRVTISEVITFLELCCNEFLTSDRCRQVCLGTGLPKCPAPSPL